ncbi:MAG: ytaF [Anaerocolumna sp.]|jgi:putative sporulation protein YtaF|nr:ytaF [Anaerocolumna sp.]
MGIFMIVLMTLAATADSFIIAFNYGIKKVIISNSSNLFIAIFCLLGTLVSMLIGEFLGGLVTVHTANILGSVVLVGFSIYMLKNALFTSEEDTHQYTQDPTAVDKDNSKVIEFKESFLIGLLLSINNMGMGIGAGITGMPILITSAVCAGASFLFIKIGCLFGSHIESSKVSRILEIISGVFVLILGILGFFD